MEIIEFRNELWECFQYLRSSMTNIFGPIVAESGLTMLQAWILIEVRTAGKATVGELGEVIGSGSGNASTMCKKLEQMGLVYRERAEYDERVVHVSLTDEGREILGKIEHDIQNRYAKVLASWPPEDFALITAGTHKIREILEALQEHTDKAGG